jgi:5'(3')-deoxyribonucleotidase
MIKKILDKDTRIEVLDALKKVHDGKEVVWIDMDGVVADFVVKATEYAEKMGLTFQEFADQKQYRHIKGFYRGLPLISGAKEAIQKLEDSGKYDLYFLSAPSWGNVSCFSDKRVWVEKHFPTFRKKMSLSFQKGHHLGHYLIDDRTKYGAGEFMGEHIQFGNYQYPDWNAVLKKLL